MSTEEDIVIPIFSPDSDSEAEKLIRRPKPDRGAEKIVTGIILDVKREGDKAVCRYGKKFDGISPEKIRVTDEELRNSVAEISRDLKKAVDTARGTIERFHRENIPPDIPAVETVPGVTCWQEARAIDRVGLYIPGGTAPLISTVLMLGIPAKLAGCSGVIICSPPGKDGKLHPAILYTATLLGIREVFKTGGAQAVAAMAYGTETIPRVYKIFGPGNQYVTLAKQRVSLDRVSIDMPAGPSELMIVAEANANPRFLAADLLSQAEHGPDSQVILLSSSVEILKATRVQIRRQLDRLPREQMVRRSLGHSRLIRIGSKDKIFRLVNQYAPEHLILATGNPDADCKLVRNAGSVFLGNDTPESAGDYISGPNHTLPTGGWGRSVSSLTVDSFRKVTSFQTIRPDGLKRLGKDIEILAAAEGLDAHREAVSVRLREYGGGGE